jgi:hypothetical protein
MFPLARRVYPAQDGRTTAMEFPVMSRASGKRVRVSTGSLHRHRSHGAHVRGLVPGAPLQAASRLRPQGAAQPAPTRTPVPGRAFPAYEPCHRSWNRTLVPSSGEDLRPWWPTARYLPRSTRTSSPPRNSQWPRRPLGSPGSRGWRDEQHPRSRSMSRSLTRCGRRSRRRWPTTPGIRSRRGGCWRARARAT